MLNRYARRGHIVKDEPHSLEPLYHGVPEITNIFEIVAGLALLSADSNGLANCYPFNMIYQRFQLFLA